MIKNKIVVIGGGGHAKVVISILKKLGNYKVVGYTDIDNKGEILGVDYLGNDEILEKLFLNKNIKNAAIGIGQIKNMLTDLETWMNDKGYKNIDDFKGKVSKKNLNDPFAYKRSQYVDILMQADDIYKKYPNLFQPLHNQLNLPTLCKYF